MSGNEPEAANRWATEHYGFVDDASARDLVVPEPATSAASDARPLSRQNGAPPSRRRGAVIASAVLSVALVAGIGGTAVASDDGHGQGQDGTTHLDGGADRGDRGGDRP
jgi:hypothetical protein